MMTDQRHEHYMDAVRGIASRAADAIERDHGPENIWAVALRKDAVDDGPALRRDLHMTLRNAADSFTKRDPKLRAALVAMCAELDGMQSF